MNYFCKVHMQSKKDQEIDTYIIFDKSKFAENETPNLTKEILLSSKQYNDFIAMYKKPKIVIAEYTVYMTEAELSEDSHDKYLEGLIENEEAEKVASAELNIDCARDKLSTKRRKKLSPALIAGIVGGVAIAGVFGVGGGMMIAKKNAPAAAEEAPIEEIGETNEDGMIIPKQEIISEEAEQLTVLIDRSYLAVPTEDFQLKGEVINGEAQITLPEFDRTDYFSHVPGYTWGFSTDPDGDKIEYYGGQTYSFTKDTKLYRVLVKYGGGSGTMEDPYIIDYYDQLELMSEEKARGYFRQAADLIFPDWAYHKPIDTVVELKNGSSEAFFEYDGDGYIISGLTAPLFGKVSGAVIKNVNIQNSSINSTVYKDYGFIACQAYNYSYDTEADSLTTDDEDTSLVTGDTLIKHCTVSHSSIRTEYPHTEEEDEEKQRVVVNNGAVKYDDNGNVVEETPATKRAEYSIGAITGIGGQIEDCYVTDFGVYAYLDEYFLYVGGISGKPANVINSAVYLYSAEGNIFNAGGIAGSCGGAKLYNQLGQELPDYYGGNIQGCAARRIILSSELTAGGIAGEGGTNVDGKAVISNSYTTELDFSVGIFEDKERAIPIKTGYSGGIIGTDGSVKYGHQIINTVSPASISIIGSRRQSSFDETVRVAPEYAYYQDSILTVINANSANPDTPKEIFAGSFEFGDSTTFGSSENGSLPYPSQIADLFDKTVIKDDKE